MAAIFQHGRQIGPPEVVFLMRMCIVGQFEWSMLLMCKIYMAEAIKLHATDAGGTHANRAAYQN